MKNKNKQKKKQKKKKKTRNITQTAAELSVALFQQMYEPNGAIRPGPSCSTILSLTSSLVVKMLTVLLSTISNSQVLLLKKMWVAFSSKNNSIYAIFNDQSINDTLTNDAVSFEQLSIED